jgi:plasmid stabilization system protein ParE
VARLKIEFLAAAKTDFREAVEWYHKNTSPKATRKLVLSLGRALDQIALFPKGCPIFRGDVRRIALRGFPYWLYYAEVGNRVQIVAIFQTKTDSDAYSARI